MNSIKKTKYFKQEKNARILSEVSDRLGRVGSFTQPTQPQQVVAEVDFQVLMMILEQD